ncbi:MAG: hypothetical protein ABR538_07015 [Candidatus Binatia bacterium]
MSTESNPDIPWTAPLAPPSSDLAGESGPGSAPVSAAEPAATTPAPPSPSELEVFGLKLTDLEEQARVMIREQPVVAVLAAAGLGYLVARLASRANR